MNSFWYRFFHGECPVCGHDASYKERVNGVKPDDDRKIHIQLSDSETYDDCVERGGL